MPEGDTVWLAGHNLRRALMGEELTRTDFRVPRYATTDLAGRLIDDIASHGKHLLLRFSGDLTLHTHFEMDGAWHLYKSGKRWHSPAFEARVVLETSSWQAVGFRMPVIELLATSSEGDIVGHLGPDLLGDTWDPHHAVARLTARAESVEGVTIGEALLDQTLMAGLGNVYKSEICFLRGLDPWTPLGSVSDLSGLVDLAKRLLEANRGSARHVTTGIDKSGRRHYVYGRRAKPCRRCGTPIRKGEQPAHGLVRVVYWCPTCQPSAPVRVKPAG